MKKFILKSAIIFILSLLLFRFTVISLVNEYEEKILSQISTSNINELKREMTVNLNSNKDNIKIIADFNINFFIDYFINISLTIIPSIINLK